MLQSPTLMLTVGYGVLEALLTGAFPAMRARVAAVHRGEGLGP